MSYLDERMQRSATAYRCTCGDLVQRRTTTTGQTVTLDAYSSNDGAYVITAELHAVRSDGPFGYRLHKCTGDE